jgi:predicted kinase
MKKSLVILRGLPGSGKSAFASLIGRARCSADDYLITREGEYKWSVDKLRKAHSWCMRKCERFMKAGIETIVVDNTTITEKELKPYLELAKKYNYKYFSIIVENRHGGKNSHGVPEETIEKRKNKFSIKL